MKKLNVQDARKQMKVSSNGLSIKVVNLKKESHTVDKLKKVAQAYLPGHVVAVNAESGPGLTQPTLAQLELAIQQLLST